MGAHMPTVRSRRLAVELRRFREQAGLTGEQVAEAMGWSVAKVYRIEGDKVRILVRDVGRLLLIAQLAAGQRDRGQVREVEALDVDMSGAKAWSEFTDHTKRSEPDLT